MWKWGTTVDRLREQAKRKRKQRKNIIKQKQIKIQKIQIKYKKNGEEAGSEKEHGVRTCCVEKIRWGTKSELSFIGTSPFGALMNQCHDCYGCYDSYDSFFYDYYDYYDCYDCHV